MTRVESRSLRGCIVRTWDVGDAPHRPTKPYDASLRDAVERPRMSTGDVIKSVESRGSAGGMSNINDKE